MTDYKQLCAELVDAIDSGIPTNRMHSSPLVLRARAALAEPEPEWPTDEEIMELMPQQFRDDLATVSRLAAYGLSLIHISEPTRQLASSRMPSSA